MPVLFVPIDHSLFFPQQVEEGVFDCDGLFQLHTWQHVAVVINKSGLRGNAKTMLYVDGNLQGTQKVFMCLRVTGNMSIAH